MKIAASERDRCDEQGAGPEQRAQPRARLDDVEAREHQQDRGGDHDGDQHRANVDGPIPVVRADRLHAAAEKAGHAGARRGKQWIMGLSSVEQIHPSPTP